MHDFRAVAMIDGQAGLDEAVHDFLFGQVRAVNGLVPRAHVSSFGVLHYNAEG